MTKIKNKEKILETTKQKQQITQENRNMCIIRNSENLKEVSQYT